MLKQIQHSSTVGETRVLYNFMSVVIVTKNWLHA